MAASRNAMVRYWDSTCFLSILNNEDDAHICERILESS